MPPKSKPATPWVNPFDAFTQTKSESEVQDFLDTLDASETTAELYRYKDNGTRPQLGMVALSLFKEDTYGYLRDNYGSGRYAIRFKDRDRRYLSGGIILEVEGPPVTQAVNTPQPVSNSQSDLLQMMQMQNQQMNQMLLALIGSNRGPDIGSLLTGLAALAPRGPDPVAMFTALVTGLGTMKGNDGGKTDFIEAIKVAKELVSGSSPETSSDTDSYLAVGGKLLDTIQTVLANRPKPVVQVQEQRRSLEEITNPNLQQVDSFIPLPPGSVEPAPEKPTTEELMLRWLQVALDNLKVKAKAGKDPIFWCDYVDENQDEEWCRAVKMAVTSGYTLEHLKTFDSEIASSPILLDWFGQFYEGLLQQPEPGTHVDLAGGAGNADDFGANEASSLVPEPLRDDPGKPTPKPKKRG